MKTIQEMLQELSQCIVTVSGEFRFRTNWSGGKVPQPDLDVFDPNVPFCIENVGDVPVEIGLYNTGKKAVRSNCKISTNLKTWSDYNLVLTNDSESNDIGRILLQNKGDRVYIKADKTPFGSYVPRPYPHTKFKVFNQSDSKKIRARGNIASLNHGSNDLYKTDYLTYKLVEDSYCYYNMFYSCTSLTQAPELPATTLSHYCYSNMFYNCTSLTQAPELPATTLANYCYYDMFMFCTSLKRAPAVLPAATLAAGCYDHMFYDCKYLTQAPTLPARILADSCYEAMFGGCTSLTQAPELPATNLAYECYFDMFAGCTSLTQAPELPATTLADYCYRHMFGNCTSLTQAPELPATTLTDYCYQDMFSYCAKLSYVKCLATDTSATSCTFNWLYGVSYTGTFECDNKKYFTLDSVSGIPTGWTITEINPEVEKPDLDTFDPNVPFCIENVGDVKANVQYNTKNTNIRISKDYKTWNDYTSGIEIELNPKDRVYIKSDYVKDTSYNPRFVFNGDGARLRARGNIASLIYGTDNTYVNKYTSTEEYCYNYMFSGCTSLTQAPELPATTLANYCYHQMFYGCTSLTQAPELPATALANYCYFQMFSGCTSLIQALELLATTLAGGCCQSMFEGCTSLTQAPKLPATTLAYMCYASMFKDCTSLTRAPELPATILHDLCYAHMFQGCTKLNYVKCLATNISAKKCTASLLEGVATTGDFYTPASTRWTTGKDGIPSGWTRHDIT